MPHKSVGSLVKYYYTWEMKRDRDDHVWDTRMETLSDTFLFIQDFATNCVFRKSYLSTKTEAKDEQLYINVDDLKNIVEGYGKVLLEDMDEEIVDCRRKVQRNKQEIEMNKKKIGSIKHLIPEVVVSRGNCSWN